MGHDEGPKVDRRHLVDGSSSPWVYCIIDTISCTSTVTHSMLYRTRRPREQGSLQYRAGSNLVPRHRRRTFGSRIGLPAGPAACNLGCVLTPPLLKFEANGWREPPLPTNYKESHRVYQSELRKW